MDDKDIIDEVMIHLQATQDGQTLALIVIRKILDDYREAEALVPMLFALRKILDKILREMPGEQ